MEYLREYNLTEKDIQEIYDKLNDEDWYTITSFESKVCDILDYFNAIGINNFKDILLNRPQVFYKNAKEIKNYINNSNVIDLIDKLNENAINFELIGL